ncbi:hypothetical protein PROPEN_02248 [Proteus penneri ATCC 35198]|nr:hypothetical protein PROPEN_02248 [Proteus penneri ATCC 35198]
MVDEDFFKNSRTTKNYVIDKLGESKLENGLIKVNDIEKYYTSGWHENSVLYFNTHNGNDIISAPSITQNTFDIYNGTKRLSGGSKDDVFNVFTSESPHYASRFYGREGNDTLCLIKKARVNTQVIKSIYNIITLNLKIQKIKRIAKTFIQSFIFIKIKGIFILKNLLIPCQILSYKIKKSLLI